MTSAVLLTLSILIPTVANPQSAPSANDVQCAIVSNAVATTSKDQKQKQVAQNMLHFYLGRIDGRFSGAQLKVEIAAQRKTITPANITATMQTCLTAVQRKLKAMQSMER